MKIWVKYVICVLGGIILGIFFPPFPQGQETWQTVTTVILGLSRLVLFPLIFFSLGVAIDSLRMDKKLIQTLLKSGLFLLGSSLVLVLFGSLVLLIFRLSPAMQLFSSIPAPQSFQDLLNNLWTFQGFFQYLLMENGLLPLYTLGFFLGFHFYANHELARPTKTLFESLSNLLYNINSFLVEILPLGMIALAAYWVIQVRSIESLGQYIPFLLVVSFASLSVIFGLVPLALYLIAKEKEPYRVLYALIAPAISGFFSGNIYFSLASLIKHNKENLGLRRKSGATTLPLFILFGRAGTAMVATMSYFFILSSVIGLEFNLIIVLETLALGLLLPLVLAFFPNMEFYSALLFLSPIHRQDQAGILFALLPILISLAVLVDTVLVGAITYMVGKDQGLTRHIVRRNFI